MRALITETSNRSSGPTTPAGDRACRLDPRRPDPSPQPGEAVVRVIRAGISSLDRAVCRGFGAFDGVLGHEGVGVVETLNAAPGSQRVATVSVIQPGQRVAITPTISCGTCDACRGGLRAHCRNLQVLGLTRDGVIADRIAVPQESLVAIPDDVDDERAVLAAATAAAIQATRQITIEGRPYITVLGDGPVGLLTAQLMSRLNASVRLLGHHAETLALCEKWSLKHRLADEVGRRADQDVVVDCTGSPGGLELAMALVRPRGRIVTKSVWGPGDANGGPDVSTIVRREITMIGSSFGPMAEAIGMIARGDVDVASLISRRFRLDDAAKALDASARPGMIKVVIEP